MKKFLLLGIVLVALLVCSFMVPPMLSAQDTVTVLLGFLTIVVSTGAALGSIIHLQDGGKGE